MRITSIDHSRIKFEDGLSKIHLRDLKKIVILAGPNGSGKSRLLQRVIALRIQEGQKRTELEIKYANVFNPIEEIFEFSDVLPFEKPTIDLSDDPTSRDGCCKFALFVAGDLPASGHYPVVSFDCGIGTAQDPRQMQPDTVAQRAGEARIAGAQHLNETALSYIYESQQAWFEVTHQDWNGDRTDAQETIDNFTSLNSIISAALGDKLGRDPKKRVPTLFGRELALADLSHGQTILLRWCVAIHAQAGKLGSHVLTMDEPENHLHPDALLRSIEKILAINKEGQLWIATHSVPLIAGLLDRFPDEVSLYCMNNGRADFAGRTPELVISSLIGGEENAGAVREFMQLPFVHATNRFAAECLLPPGVIAEAVSDDPQASIAESAVFADKDNNEKLQVLDFGAGHGRILDCIAIGKPSIENKLDYIAWDEHGQCRDSCIKTIAKFYKNPEERWFCKSSELAGKWGQNTFDAVIMCNVLHEIAPNSWTSLFGETGVVSRSLKSDGRLIVIEDYLMPKGEHAHPLGFIVLDTDCIQVLFNAKQPGQIQVIQARGKYKDRIKAHVIAKELLSGLTSATLKGALRLAAESAEVKLSELRNSNEKSFRSGQAHGFWVQQFTNATIAYKQLAGTSL